MTATDIKAEDNVSRVSDPEKDVQPGTNLPESKLDRFEDPDEGVSEQERAKRVSLPFGQLGLRLANKLSLLGTRAAMEARSATCSLALFALSHCFSGPVRESTRVDGNDTLMGTGQISEMQRSPVCRKISISPIPSTTLP